MNELLYSVRSRSHVHLPYDKGPTISKLDFTTSPKDAPLPSPYPGDEQNLCATCRNVELDGQSQEYFKIWHIFLGKLLTIINTPDCTLCTAITKAISPVLTPSVLKYAENEANIIQVFLAPLEHEAGLKICFWNVGRDGHHKNFEESISYELNSKFRILRIEEDSLTKSRIFSTSSLRPSCVAKQLQRGQCDLGSVKRHLRCCVEQHRDTCDQRHQNLRKRTDEPSAPQSWLESFRVIDVEQLRVVTPPPDCSYLALSYVWDHSNKGQFLQATNATFPDLCKPKSLALSRLPQTVVDALFVCQQLGERYLWVDALCIIQDNIADVAAQVTRMDEVYSLARATIVAACGHSASKGLSCLRARDPPQAMCSVRGIRYIASEPPLSQTLEDTLWYTRGWTYQEYILSKRLIIFTSSQVFFVCSRDTYPEYITFPDRPFGEEYQQSSFEHLSTWDMPGMGYANSAWMLYNGVVVDYTQRQLTVESDRLPAISGVLQSFGRYCDDIFLCGLPAKQFPYSLLWHPSGGSERSDGWPSWSWAGWTGHVFNPIVKAVQSQWGRGPRTFVSALEDLRFRGEDGIEVRIDQTPGDEELMGWLNDYLARSQVEYRARSQNKYNVRSQSKYHDMLRSGHLIFTGQSTHLSITPDPDASSTISPVTPMTTPPVLCRYRIQCGASWLGTVFLTTAQAASYPTRTDDLEFLLLTRCTISIHMLAANLLSGFGDWDTVTPDGFNDPRRREPAIFDGAWYDHARRDAEMEYHMRRMRGRGMFVDSSMDFGGSWKSGPDPGMPESPKMHLSHVMLLERVGDVVERKAVGLMVPRGTQWSEKREFCLG